MRKDITDPYPWVSFPTGPGSKVINQGKEKAPDPSSWVTSSTFASPESGWRGCLPALRPETHYSYGSLTGRPGERREGKGGEKGGRGQTRERGGRGQKERKKRLPWLLLPLVTWILASRRMPPDHACLLRHVIPHLYSPAGCKLSCGAPVGGYI